MSAERFDTDVAVIGSGFGGSVAALRFVEAGQKVLIIERGRWVSREAFEADLDATWNPKRNRFGFNDIQRRGRHILPWLGCAVGGGSHVYAGTLKRRQDFHGFPKAIRDDDMTPYYQRAEEMLDANLYPDWEPYSNVRATQLLFRAGKKLEELYPDVEGSGPVNLGISFAPPGASPGDSFVNKHGCRQRYWDPQEQSLLGGDIDTKNTLDKNYLFLAQKGGAEIRTMTEVDKIEPLDGGGYRIHCLVHRPSKTRWQRFARSWLPFCGKIEVEPSSYTARRVVVSAGSIGSTELLLRSRDVHRLLPSLSALVGQRYTTNGDFISLILPFRGVFVSWAGLIAAIYALIDHNYWLLGAAIFFYLCGILVSRKPFDPDIGTTNSDYIQFRGQDGKPQGAYIESGRYPTPGRLLIAVYLSTFGMWRPRRYRQIIRYTNFLRKYVPPFALFARTWPIPLLKMGGDDAYGKISLDQKGKAAIDYDVKANLDFYRYLNQLARRVARVTRSWWIPNLIFRVFRILEVPHNQGGLPMGAHPNDGVVDHAGRVFGYQNLMVLDGSIIPVSPRPNPALTITALCERAMVHILEQLKVQGDVTAEETPDKGKK